MSEKKKEKPDTGDQKKEKKDRAGEIANTFEWLITAFILAFVFRAFVLEAFRIPTGSMADTLKGAHFRLRCEQCGYVYDYGFVPSHYNMAEDTVPTGLADVPETYCPSCGYYHPPGTAMPVANGDRILVLKCIYQFLEPKRWDVIVFKNPPEPEVNYIKRLIGLPGETVQIIDGDIYINGQICRKPPKVQNELWMTVYDNDYQPINPLLLSFNKHQWQQPFKNSGNSRWKISDSDPTRFHLESSAGSISTLVYDTSAGNDFRTAYSYDNVNTYDKMPVCSDLMTRFYCQPASSEGRIGITLSKYETDYQAYINFPGEMVITKTANGGENEILCKKNIGIDSANQEKLTRMSFANVDHKLVFEYGDHKIEYDLGRNPEDAGTIREEIEPRVEIFGSGKLTLSHIAIFRDIHYITAKNASSNFPNRASENNPFTLNEDEFFVLGDNSPNSEDGRWWNKQGLSNEGIPPYRTGVVPRDYLVGKALFVYWPSGFKPFPKFPFGIIPNIGNMRFIYGGSDKEY